MMGWIDERQREADELDWIGLDCLSLPLSQAQDAVASIAQEPLVFHPILFGGA